MRSGTQIEHYDIRVEQAKSAQQTNTSQMAWLRVGEVALGRGDQFEIRNRGVDQQLSEIFFALGDEISQAASRSGYTETGVQVRPFEIRVDDHDSLAESCQSSRKIRGDEGLADTALASAHREQSGARIPWSVRRAIA